MKGKSKILIVDDNTENLSILGNILMSKDYTVQVAQNGKSAINAVHKKQPDLILLDINMPGLTGYDVCRTLKEDKKTSEIPVIFLTAHTETEHIVEGFSLGAVDYITKPFSEEELLSRVKTHLELRKAKIDLEQKNKELKELITTKDKLFSIIAHDLKGPIAAMMQMSEFLTEEDTLDNSMIHDFLIDQKELSYSTYQLLENLLNWARFNRDQILFKPKKIRINELIDENLLHVKFRAKQKAISIITDYTELSEAYADADMINLVIRNLLTNAVKFTTPKGSVTINIEKNTDQLRIKITDTGVGISEDNLKKILSGTEFYSSFGTDNENGTGLGLKLVRSFVEKNNGILTIESELNKGTSVSFTLPKSQ